MHPGDLAVAFIALGLELAQGLGQSSAGAAGTSPTRARDSPHFSSGVNGNVREGEEDIALPSSGLINDIISRERVLKLTDQMSLHIGSK